MNDYLDLHALADGEIDDAGRARISEKLRTNPTLNREYESICALKASVRNACGPVENQECWAAVRERLGEIDKVNRVQEFVGKYAWGICGAFLLFIVGGAMLNRNLAKNTLYTGDMPKLMSSLSPVPLLGNSDIGQNDLGKMAEGAPLQQSLHDLNVRAAHKGFFEGRRAMSFELADLKGALTLIVVSDTDEIRAADDTTADREYRTCQVNRQNCITWVDRGFAFLLFGDRSDAELRSAADSIR